MAIVRPELINAAICEALGLDPSKTNAVTITLKPQQATTVKVVQFVTVEDSDRLAEVLRRFTLQEA